MLRDFLPPIFLSALSAAAIGSAFASLNWPVFAAVCSSVLVGIVIAYLWLTAA